jgi:cytochrome c-type protein NapC
MASWIIANPFLAAALVCASGSAILSLWFLLRRPALGRTTKLVLLVAIGVLPLATATTGNVAGFEATKTRQFCGSCHVMTPYRNDSEDPRSPALAARHARNGLFGEENCYACHADYGMFGTVVTKMGGMRHIYEYVFNYRDVTLEEARATIHIRKPFPNATCMHCHSTANPGWNAVKEHVSTLDRVRAGTLSCASEGCHGPAHPFSKVPFGAPVNVPVSAPLDSPVSAPLDSSVNPPVDVPIVAPVDVPIVAPVDVAVDVPVVAPAVAPVPTPAAAASGVAPTASGVAPTASTAPTAPTAPTAASGVVPTAPAAPATAAPSGAARRDAALPVAPERAP